MFCCCSGHRVCAWSWLLLLLLWQRWNVTLPSGRRRRHHLYTCFCWKPNNACSRRPTETRYREKYSNKIQNNSALLSKMIVVDDDDDDDDDDKISLRPHFMPCLLFSSFRSSHLLLLCTPSPSPLDSRTTTTLHIIRFRCGYHIPSHMYTLVVVVNPYVV